MNELNIFIKFPFYLVSSFISNVDGKTTNNNKSTSFSENIRLPPHSSLSSQHYGINKSISRDGFLRPTISFKQYGYGNNGSRQQNSSLLQNGIKLRSIKSFNKKIIFFIF